MDSQCLEKDHTFITNLLGMPYKERVFDGSGFDCFTLVYHIYRHHGIKIPKTIVGTYTLKNIHREVENHRRKQYWYEVDFADRQFLDILLFATSANINTHIGIVYNQKRFIHTTKDTNVIISKFRKNLYTAKIKKVYRWHELK